MPKISTVDKMPREFREKLSEKLLDGGSTYDELVDWCEENGYTISRSTLARFGKAFLDDKEGETAAEEKIAEYRMRCLELADGETEKERMKLATRYLNWVLYG